MPCINIFLIDLTLQGTGGVCNLGLAHQLLVLYASRHAWDGHIEDLSRGHAALSSELMGNNGLARCFRFVS